jgi:UPF0755 protein
VKQNQNASLEEVEAIVKSEYNTYYVPGLPAGPICAVSDASLKAALGAGNGTDIYFFYHDYVLNDMFFFEDYVEFQKDGKVSGQRFDENSKIGRRDKVNKQTMNLLNPSGT